MSNMTEQILFSGRVQGVGFRWTTQRIASGLPVNGFVRNLPDGRVEVVVAGTPANIQSLIDGLHNQFGSGITEVRRHTFAEAEEFDGFAVR